jgi:lycopene cyclase CruA
VSLLLDYALRHNLLEEQHLRLISPHQANLRVAWVFSRFMQPWRGGDPAAVNRIMNVFCNALGSVGPRATVRFLQDRYTFAEYISIMLTTARHYPRIFAVTASVLGPSGLAKWATDIASFATADLIRLLQPRISRPLWRKLERLATHYAPAIALRIISARTLFRSLE